MAEITIKRFQNTDIEEWDNFLLNKPDTIFNIFLQTRNFLNYHPYDRFCDHSLMFYCKQELIAVLPAVEICEEKNKIFFSHKGSTFGGFAIRQKYYNAETVLQLLKILEEYLKTLNFSKIIIKHPSDIFCKENTDLWQYAFYYFDYKSNIELSTFIDFSTYKKEILSNFEQGKRTNVNGCLKAGFTFRELESAIEMDIFYAMLSENLKKYGAFPVHTIQELIDFKNSRLKNIVNFFGVFDSDQQMQASGMTFIFRQTNFLHTQYLCASNDLNRLSPMTFLYYNLIKMAMDVKMNGISFGVSTEKNGKYLNSGLIRSKEAYGSKYSVNRTYLKDLL